MNLGILLTVSGIMFIWLVIFLICRDIVCWYWKINRGIDLLEQIHAELVAARKENQVNELGSKYIK